MYRLMLYFLTALVLVAITFCFIGILPYNGWDLIGSLIILIAVSWVANRIFATILRISVNIESDYITAFILSLIVTPGSSIKFLIIVAVLAQASKYILAYRGKHLFNPAAVAVLITFYTIGSGASWWIGGAYILPVVIIGGFLIIRKIQRFDLTISFLVTSLITFAYASRGADIWLVWQTLLVNSSLLFFACVMLPEPLTTPPTRKLRIIYGVIVGILYSTSFNIGQIFSSPELALVLGNVFSFIVSSKGRYKLMLKSKQLIANGMYSFAFDSNHKLKFKPGQYMEWTIDGTKSDTRGNRRYFTVASSPTEQNVLLGVRFYENPSTFKQKLSTLNPGDKILAGQLTGDFTMPTDPNQKLVFIAGGIGITPFRSMIKYMLDTNDKRDTILFYSVKNESEIAYRDILEQASRKLGTKVIYVETDKSGFLNAEMINAATPDLDERMYYISGPRSMVTAFEKLLRSLGVPGRQIRVDFFPGYV